MSELRSLIREILAEEIASLRAEHVGGVVSERVAVGDGHALTRFALEVARKAADPAFVAALESGHIRYEPAHTAPLPPSPAISRVPASVSVTPECAPGIVTSTPPSIPELRKTLVTERDIAAIEDSTPRLRVLKGARITPLAGDEARRRGIRIERTLA